MPVWVSDPTAYYARRLIRGAFCICVGSIFLANTVQADPLRDRLQTGLWGSDFYADQMCSNPHRVTLADGDQRMIFTWDKPILYHSGAMLRVIGSTVVARSYDRYTVVQDGEDRLGEDGTPLRFDVFLTADGGYCFYEAGFGVADCPHPNRDCGPAPPNA